MEGKVIKPSPNRIRPYFTKRLTFLQQKENTPERKTIKAKKLEEICNLISPPFSHCFPVMQHHSDDTNIFHTRNLVIRAFLYNNWDIEDRDCPYYWQDFNVSDIQMAKKRIAKLGLSENIKLHLPMHSDDDGVVAEKIEIKNLNIEGDFQAEFNHIRRIELTNNVFQGHTAIRVIGSPQCCKCTFRSNQFLESFTHLTFNADSIDFIGNKILGRVNLYFAPPLMNEISSSSGLNANEEGRNRDLMSITNSFNLVESHLKFTNNKIFILTLQDKKELAEPYNSDALPFRKIEFLGDNAIDYLSIETDHTALNGSSGIRADINKIFFDVSDKISPSVRTSNMRYTTDGHDSLARKHQISYLEFFSLLKVQATKQHTPVLEDIYAKKIRYFSRVLVSRWQDKFIFRWGNWISDGGESWTKPLKLFVSLQLALSFIAWLSVWSLEPSVSFWALFFEFLNPLSGLPSLEPSKAPAWTAFLLLFHKLVAAVTIYEAIKALRRFSK